MRLSFIYYHYRTIDIKIREECGHVNLFLVINFFGKFTCKTKLITFSLESGVLAWSEGEHAGS